MAYINLNGVALATESGGTVALDSATSLSGVTIPAAGVTGVLPVGVTGGSGLDAIPAAGISGVLPVGVTGGSGLDAIPAAGLTGTIPGGVTIPAAGLTGTIPGGVTDNITTLGTVTAGTLGSAVTMPDRVLFDYNLLSTGTRYTLNNSGTNAGLGGFTGTLTYASEIHVLKFNCFRGGTQSSASNDSENFAMSVTSSATPATSNGQPTDSLLPDFNEYTGQYSFYFCDVPIATSVGTYGDAYNFYNQDAMTYATVTGTAGVTTYAYYPWFWNPSGANSYLGGSKSDPNRCGKTIIEFWRYTV